MELQDLYQRSLRRFLEPITELLDSPDISEVMINGPDQVYYEQAGRICRSESRFRNEQSLLAAARNIAEYVDRPLGPENLSMDARLPDGSRVHVILPPVSRCGICITIRKFRSSSYTLEELIKIGSLNSHSADLLSKAVAEHRNVIIAGGTGTGKTSLLNALSRLIEPQERIVVIEESSELQLHQPHTIYLEARADSTEEATSFSVRELFVNALRMRPDRILIGEVRRGEALELVQSMLSGHSGSLATIHASSPQAAATRLETLCLMNDIQLPVYVARAQVAAAVDLFVQTARSSDGKRRVTHIYELLDLDDAQKYCWNSLFHVSC